MSRRPPFPGHEGRDAARRRPLWKDPWAWASALSVLPLLVKSLGAPLGEPVAEDFNYLHHALLSGGGSLLDGGGSQQLWRPLSLQLHYRLLGETILAHPEWVAVLRAVVLAASAVVLYAFLRRHWSPGRAAAGASFGMLMESVRTVVSWPAHMGEALVLLYSVTAVAACSAGRLAAGGAALLLALLSKEVGVVAALLAPWAPGARRGTPRARIVTAALLASLVAAWAIAYAWVRRTADLELPGSVTPVALSWPERWWWAVANSLRATLSLPAMPTPWESAVGWGLATLAIAVVVAGLARPASRRRMREALPWAGWGIAWFALSSLVLASVYPEWAPTRTLFGSVGLGIAVAALLGAVHAAALGVLAAARLALLLASPGPPPIIASQPPELGAFLDFPRLVRLQRLMRDTRAALRGAFPSLPAGARVGQHHMPQLSEYAFEGHRALQVWYRDTTLRWVRYDAFQRAPETSLATFVEYQTHSLPQIALVAPGAMRALVAATASMDRGDHAEAIRRLDGAEALQRDPGARVFLGTVAGLRAWSHALSGDSTAAERDARRGLALWPANPNSRLVLANLRASAGRLAEAQAELDSHFVGYPADCTAVRMERALKAAAAAGR